MNRVRILFFLCIIAVRLWSINVLVSMSNNGAQNVSPISFPTDADTLALREHILDTMNQERTRSGLVALNLDNNLIAQRYVEQLATTDKLTYNPQLPSGMKENIVRRDISQPFRAQNIVDEAINDMGNNDAANNWVNRDAILNKDYTKVSIGVAWNNNYLYLVRILASRIS